MIALNQEINQHYGHAGPRFVDYLVRNREQWAEWRAAYEEARQRYERLSEGNSVAGRMAAHCAALELTGFLAERAQILPWDFGDLVAQLWPELIAETPEADRAAAALRHVYDWACSHAEQFFGKSGVDEPSGGWAGRWDRIQIPSRQGGISEWAYLGFFRAPLAKVLTDAGFDAEAVIRGWKDRGWLVTDTEGKPRQRARIGTEQVSLLAIKHEAIVEVEGEPIDEEPPLEPTRPAAISGGNVPQVEQAGNNQGTA